MLNGRLADARLQACGFQRQACRFIKADFRLFFEAFRRIFHALIHLGKEKNKKNRTITLTKKHRKINVKICQNMKKSRRKFTSVFKTKVVLELLKERNTLSEIAQKYEIHPTIISKWKSEFLEKASIVFETEKEKTKESFDPEELFKEIGKMKVENEWLKKKLDPYL